VLYFATYYLETGSGVMVTGSHNPPQYNGLKIMLGGDTLFGDDIQALRTRIGADDLHAGAGNLQSMDISADYIRRVSEDVPVALGNAFKVVIDCGNGVAGDFAPKLMRALGHDVVELYCEIDGNFPNHHPDPSQPENLADLIAAVKEHDADLGFAFDGDGDRLGMVDASGRIVWPDTQMMLFARDVLSRNAGAEIVFDVKCSSRLGKVIAKLGGKPVMYKTGHSFIKNKLKETGAPLAGEMSGHIFFKERWYGFDDALYAASRMLEILMGFKQKPTEVFSKLPAGVSTPELRVDMKEGENLSVMASLADTGQFADARVSTIDGVRVDWKDGWGLVRASNTTPSLVLRFEGDNEQALARIKETFRKLLLDKNPDLSLPF
jgi:phosphomannomutase/phosphoglucomutase